MLSRLPIAALRNSGAAGGRVISQTRCVSVRSAQASPKRFCLDKHDRFVSSSASATPASGYEVCRLPVLRRSCGLKAFQAFVSSRATLVSVSLFTLGSIAWYTHLDGTIPFLGEVRANSPAEEGLHPTHYPWSHDGYLDTFDHAR
jgi:ubiquinol-cytochrome c reductase cytochrome c1 subunit